MGREYNIAFAVFSLMLAFNYVSNVKACGPGGGSKPDVPVRKFYGDRIPDIYEESSMASGKNEGALQKDDRSLKKIISTDIIFADPSYDADSRKATEPCEQSLIKLAGVAKIYWKEQYKLYVTEGYLSVKKNSNRENSLHYSGRAFDVSLVSTKSTKDPSKKFHRNIKYHMLRNLAYLAYYNAKFSFVEIKKHHIHVSCPKKSARRTTSRCFPGESFVRGLNGKSIKMKDTKVGDKILTMDSMGLPVYSEITMMMHQNKDVNVEDYVQISTTNERTITLSSYHLIFISKTQSVFSKDVKVGQQVYIYNVENNAFLTSLVRNISTVRKLGVYAPLTTEGTIVVDDVYASCYALFPSHTVSHAVFYIWRIIYPLMKHFQSAYLAPNTEYHWYADIFRQSLNNLIIFPYSL